VGTEPAFSAEDRKRISPPEIRAERPIRAAVSAAARRASPTSGFRRRRLLTGFFRVFEAEAAAVFATAVFFTDFFTTPII
jgi:hypothetical protein